jgi:TatD DNase family protein
MKFYDIHTHRILPENNNDNPRCSCIINVSPLEFETAKELYRQHVFSCGIHPWQSDDNDTQMTYLSEIAAHPRIVAIGETGLDKLKGSSLDTQEFLFGKHIELSEKLKKPLIVHCVKAWDELIRIHRETKPTQSWIIHGYRGKPELTKQLVKEGFLFSVGDKINAHSIPLIPIDSLFCETDESETDIREIYLQVSKVLNMSVEQFGEKVAENVCRVFQMTSNSTAEAYFS